MKFADKVLQNNYKIVLAAVTSKGPAIEVVTDPILQVNDTIVAAAFAQDITSFRVMAASLKANHQIALQAVRGNSNNWLYIDNNLKENVEIACAALQRNQSIAHYFSTTLLEDPVVKSTLASLR